MVQEKDENTEKSEGKKEKTKHNIQNEKEEVSQESVDKKSEEAETTPIDETKDRLLRLAAEFDNYKKRVARDSEEARSIGKAELMKKIIPVLDEFELAITSMSDSSDEHMRKGMELIYSNLISTLKGEGLSVIGTDGVYDPYKHEIIMIKESNKKPGTILEIVRKGYQFNNMLLRPASVIVAKEMPEKDDDKTQG